MRIGIDCRKIADFGIGTYVRGLVQALAELGGEEQYVLFVPSPIDSPFEQVVVNAPHYSVRELLVLGRAIAKAKLDLFHAPHFVLPWTSCPSIVTIHDAILVHYPPPQPGGSFYYSLMMRRALRKSVRVLTVSESAKRDIVQAFPCDPSKIEVTPNGVDAIFFERGPAAEGRYFLYVGNDKPHKNVETLVAAFALVRHESPQAKLVMAGGDFSRFGNVDARGFVSDAELSALYANAIALVVPSHEEGFGLPAAEAMAHGTAVITSRDPALVEVTGDAALHVDANDARALADAMLRVTRITQLRSHLGEKGIARAQNLTWKRCAEATRAAYEGALR